MLPYLEIFYCPCKFTCMQMSLGQLHYCIVMVSLKELNLFFILIEGTKTKLEGNHLCLKFAGAGDINYF